MTNETTASERDRFEAWALSVGWHDRDLIRAHSGDYREWGTQKAWQGWLARAALPAPADQPPDPQGSSGSLSESGVEVGPQDAAEFRAAMERLTHEDLPGGSLWGVTSVREKSLMLKAWRAGKQNRLADWELLSWLQERRDNCEAIAKTKRGADAAGWLEDRDYFSRAVAALSNAEAAVQDVSQAREQDQPKV